MILSQTAEHALRAVLFVAQRADRLVRVSDIAAGLRIPRNYLSKILHVLAREGVLASTRGKAGGFRLAIPAERLTLITVVEQFDHFDERRQCLLGRPTCTDRAPCAVHSRWRHTAELVADFFRDTTVSDVLHDTRSTAIA